MTPGFNTTDWQLFLYVLFSVFMLFSAWQGWLHGLGRGLMILLGVPVGYVAGLSLGFIINNLYEMILPYPKPMVEMFSDVLFGILIYLVFFACAMFMFISTKRQTSTRKKLTSGIGGAIVGLLNGTVVFVVLIILLRIISVQTAPIPARPGSVDFLIAQEVELPEETEQTTRISAQLNNALLSPPLEEYVRLADPIPEDYYRLLLNIRILEQRGDIRQVFNNNPQLREILNSPEVASVLENSNYRLLLQEGELHALIREPEFRELYDRDATRQLMETLDWLTMTNEVIQNSDLANYEPI